MSEHNEQPKEEVCGLCRKPLNQTPPMGALFLWVPGVKKPFLLCSDEEFVFCRNDGCPSVIHFIKRAIDGNPLTRHAADGWHIARVVFYDPNFPDWRIEPKNPKFRALA